MSVKVRFLQKQVKNTKVSYFKCVVVPGPVTHCHLDNTLFCQLVAWTWGNAGFAMMLAGLGAHCLSRSALGRLSKRRATRRIALRPGGA
jgi:hypothetical protein